MPENMFNAENPLEEQLVAYLDGELDAESSRRIEELIASDAEIRGKLQRLQQTWEMLDELEFARVGEQFTHSTLEMVALAAEDDARAIMAEAPRRRRRGWLLGAIVLVAAGLAGFLAVSLTRVDPNRQLAADLPLLINFDRYLQIGNIDFLRLLHHAGLFLKPTGSAAHLTVDAPTPYDAAQYIHGLSSAEKAELQRKQNGFLALSAAEQNRLRQLHKQIQADSHSTDLYETMRAYYEWLKSLPAYTRIELQELSDTARIEWIKKRLHQEKLENAARLPSAKDAQVILSWLEEYASKRKQEFIDSLPLPQRQRIMSMKLAERPRILMFMLWQRLQAGAKDFPSPNSVEMAELLQKFTPETQQRLNALPPAAKIRTIETWARDLLRQLHLGRGKIVSELFDEEQLVEFFEKGLTGEQRDRLMSLPGEEMQRELLRLYLLHAKIKKPRQPSSEAFAPEDQNNHLPPP